MRSDGGRCKRITSATRHIGRRVEHDGTPRWNPAGRREDVGIFRG